MKLLYGIILLMLLCISCKNEPQRESVAKNIPDHSYESDSSHYIPQATETVPNAEYANLKVNRIKIRKFRCMVACTNVNVTCENFFNDSSEVEQATILYPSEQLEIVDNLFKKFSVKDSNCHSIDGRMKIESFRGDTLIKSYVFNVNGYFSLCGTGYFGHNIRLYKYILRNIKFR